MDKTNIKKIEYLTDFELNELIKKGDTDKGDEIFQALKELRIREQLKYNENHKNTKTEYKKINIPLKNKINFNAILSISSIILFIFTITYLSLYKKDDFAIDYLIYNQSTTGIIKTVKSKNVFKQGLDGAKEITLYYIVFYDFQINNSSFSDSMLIKNKTGNFKYLNSLKDNLDDTVPILYSKDNPKINMIDLNKLIK